MTNANSSSLRQAVVARAKVKPHKNVLTAGSKWTTEASNPIYEIPPDTRNRSVDIEPLKLFANQNLSQNHPLRKLLAEERSLLSASEYVAKCESWLALFRITELR